MYKFKSSSQYVKQNIAINKQTIIVYVALPTRYRYDAVAQSADILLCLPPLKTPCLSR